MSEHNTEPRTIDSPHSDARFLPPLAFEPIFKEKVWGGREMERVLGKQLPGPPETALGESWELADLGRTSPSGGGGSAERSRVADGPLAGMTLQDLIRDYGSAVLGDLPLNAFDEFPLLVKFLDARENLSVQVHPSPDYAANHDDAFVKNEAWYIVDAEPDAVIYKGVKPGVTAEQVRSAIQAGTLESLLTKVPVQPGDCHYLPSGTVHALGAGLVVAEVQTPSDTTYRVYDWGRQNRELHMEQALQCMSLRPTEAESGAATGTEETDGLYRERLVECDAFRIERLEAAAGYDRELELSQPRIWMVLWGNGRIEPSGEATEIAGAGSGARRFGRGQTLLLPPAMGRASLRLTERTRWLEITFPAVE